MDTRRDFLKTGALAGVGLLIGMRLTGSGPAQAADAPFAPNAYLQIGSDGQIIIYAKNPEIGQGIKTALPQIVAEELEVDWQQIQVVQAWLDQRLGAQFAGGSTGVKSNFMALRKAGASAREMLVEAGAQQWKLAPEQCFASRGHVCRKDSDARLPYAALAQAAAKLAPRENPTLKNPRDFKIIGQPLGGVDVRAIVTGKAEFGLDARPPGALVAVIERCPYYGGKIKSVSDAAALKVAGVQRVMRLEPARNRMRMGAGVAVIATNTWAALKARKLLVIEWERAPGVPESTQRQTQDFVRLLDGKAEVLRDDGDAAAAIKASKHVLNATYEAPFLAHATMEPMNYVADVQADKAVLWGPTQVPGSARQFAAELTGLAPDKITVHLTRAGGGFGRRLMADYAYEAIYLSHALKKPVQVVWSREDDLAHDFFRPAGMYRLSGALDEQRRLSAWHIKACSTSRNAFSGSSNPAHATEVFPDGFPAGLVSNFKMEYVALPSLVPRGAWRAPGHNATAWMDQCFIDELAKLAGKDPVAFRLEVLGKEDKTMPYRDHGGPTYSTARLKHVIRQAAAKAGWDQPAPKGVFRGFAAHFMFGAYVAEVVSISLKNGVPKVEKVLAVVDCGLVINPSSARNQIEGGIVDGLSAALFQSARIEDGRASDLNFDRYRLLRMAEAPAIEVHFVDSAEAPEGLGEMSLPAVAAALCNAIHAATGKRIRRLPVGAQLS